MTRTIRVGYAMMAALVLSAVAAVAAALLFQLPVWQALVLLALLDLVIIIGGYRIAKRSANADRDDAR